MLYLKKQFLKMRIRLQEDFLTELNNQVEYISRDKPVAARRFKSEFLKSIKNDLKHPFYFKKSIYFNNENIRDYVFKGYVAVYIVDVEQKIVSVFGFIKHKHFL